jgi:uncharacterized protein (TIGR02271 family)
MSRTVTALYDSRAEAEAARDRLASEVNVEGRAQIIDQSSQDEQGSSRFHSVPLSNEDRPAYGEGLNRGGFMLCAEVDEDEDADRIVSILEQTSSVDMDERQNTWRNEGWQGHESSRQQSGSFQGEQENIGGAQTGERTVEEERIPVVEEQLTVGKREVNRGGAKVRSYVREVPVSEQVQLRQEDVSVERRPVNEPIPSADLDRSALLQEREVEMRATGEEPVIGKEARVNEEVVLRKTVGERTENVQDTVRQTEVDVDEGEFSRDR